MSEKYVPTLVIAIILLIQCVLIVFAEAATGFLWSLGMLFVWNGFAVQVFAIPKAVRELVAPFITKQPGWGYHSRRGSFLGLMLFPWLILAVATIGWLSSWLFGVTAGRIVVAFLVVLIWLVLKSPDRVRRPQTAKRPPRKKSKIILR